MREIKCRAWNPSEDIMRYSKDFYNLRDFFGWVCLNDLQDKFTVMLSTGLTDSFAVEEWFGDIIEEEDGTKRVIEDGCSAVLFKDIKTGDIIYFWHLGVHRVIGHIYKDML